MELELPNAIASEEPLFRSRFGGLWIDRRDAHELLAGRLSRGEVTAKEAETLTHYIDHGYVIFPKAVGDEVIDAYLELFELSWDEAPPSVYVHVERRVRPMSREFYDKITKVSCLHCCFDHAAELIFPLVVLRFLTLIYDRPPVAFQTMTMRKGSEETLHIDTGPLTLTEPMTMAASWLALEDVRPGSGELEFVPGSHSVPEYLHPSMSKGHNNDMTTYGAVLKQMKAACVDRGFITERFEAKKGDVLIWHADLLHGGAKIEDPSSTRKSLVTHFMPLGVMPTFYDSSEVSALPYPNGGYCLDHLEVLTRKAAAADNGAGESPPQAPNRLRRLKRYVPLPVRKVLREQVDWLTSNPTLESFGHSKGTR
jgi:ectoine hydroxylase-related dioxygenase (phytanoyl-CoA dioxygenase family)